MISSAARRSSASCGMSKRSSAALALGSGPAERLPAVSARGFLLPCAVFSALGGRARTLLGTVTAVQRIAPSLISIAV